MVTAMKERQTGTDDVATRLAAVDWNEVSTSLGGFGWAPLGKLLTAVECATSPGFTAALRASAAPS